MQERWSKEGPWYMRGCSQTRDSWSRWWISFVRMQYQNMMRTNWINNIRLWILDWSIALSCDNWRSTLCIDIALGCTRDEPVLWFWYICSLSTSAYLKACGKCYADFPLPERQIICSAIKAHEEQDEEALYEERIAVNEWEGTTMAPDLPSIPFSMKPIGAVKAVTVMGPAIRCSSVEGHKPVQPLRPIVLPGPVGSYRSVGGRV